MYREGKRKKSSKEGIGVEAVATLVSIRLSNFFNGESKRGVVVLFLPKVELS